jgi:hypothetical protein
MAACHRRNPGQEALNRKSVEQEALNRKSVAGGWAVRYRQAAIVEKRVCGTEIRPWRNEDQ